MVKNNLFETPQLVGITSRETAAVRKRLRKLVRKISRNILSDIDDAGGISFATMPNITIWNLN